MGALGLIQNPGNDPDNATTTAGVTFLGQFLDHDMTFDATSRLGVPPGRSDRKNTRTPSSISTRSTGADRSPTSNCTISEDRVKFKIERLRALIRRPAARRPAARRSSRTRGMKSTSSSRGCRRLSCASTTESSTSCAPAARTSGCRTGRGGGRTRRRQSMPRRSMIQGDTRLRSVFAEARRLVTWHYQWIIVNEFLPQHCRRTRWSTTC